MSEETERTQTWFVEHVPGDWFTEPPVVTKDPDEILVVGAIPEVETPDEATEEARTAAVRAAVARFRKETRRERIGIASEAEAEFDTKVSWGVRHGEQTYLFTHLSIPSMTRLRIRERRVLDTLIDAGVAHTRSEALAWCVRLVGKNEAKWLDELREAFKGVEKVRAAGPYI